MSVLLVHLPAGPVSGTTEFAYALTPNGVTAVQHGTVRAALLPAPAGAGAEVVAIAPVSMLSWHRVELPKGVGPRSPRVRQVLEGLLEDRLLDETDTIHFALAPDARAEAPVWVATCDREWLRGALTALEGARRRVSRIVPEFTPEGAASLHAMGEPEHSVLVVSGSEGVAALPLAASSLPLLPSLPEDTPCMAEPAVAALAEQVLRHAPTLQQAPDRWLQAMRSRWDLAQFEFSNSGGARAIKQIGSAWAGILAAPQWRAARWAAVALVVINLVALNAAAWRERSALDAKRAGVRDMLTRTFPNVRVVVDAPAQMEKEVALLRQAAGAPSGRDLETMLAAVGSAAGPRSVTGVDYVNGELRLRGIDGADLASPLRAQGYAATPRGDSVVVTAETAP